MLSEYLQVAIQQQCVVAGRTAYEAGLCAVWHQSMDGRRRHSIPGRCRCCICHRCTARVHLGIRTCTETSASRQCPCRQHNAAGMLTRSSRQIWDCGGTEDLFSPAVRIIPRTLQFPESDFAKHGTQGQTPVQHEHTQKERWQIQQ